MQIVDDCARFGYFVVMAKQKILQPTSIRLPTDLRREIREAAVAEDRSVNTFMVRALRAAVEKSKQDRGVAT